MPPKKNDKKPTAKTQKVVEDKTFGMKNKKGAKAQKFIQVVQKQVQNKNDGPKRSGPNESEIREKKKLEEQKAKEELRDLFKPVMQTVPKGVDPKSVVCVYFKQGTCKKGDRCKFSHDLAVERKTQKRNIYEDTREADNMADWDEDKLKTVVEQKHGEENKKRTTTEIVCKFFLEAVEKKLYGWFWSCPNGDKCMYRHALPPGFVLKSEMKAAAEANKGDSVSMEMLVERERASLGKNTTKVTLETFLAWKKRKIVEKKQEKIIEETKKKSNFKMGLHQGLSGRDLFTFNPTLVADDDDGVDDGFDYKTRIKEEGEDEFACKDVDLSQFQATENDGTGTTVTDDRFSYMDSVLKQENDVKTAAGDVGVDDVDVEVDEAQAGNKPTTSKADNKKGATGIEIDESLFNADDLDGIDDELDDLEIED